MPTTNRTRVFMCYSHRNRRFLDELHEHLAPALRAGIIELWDDTRLQGGEEWREEIRKALAATKVAICLVSASFRASKFIAEDELPSLLKAAKEDGLIVLPVIVGTCDFQESELAGFQAVNDPSRPLMDMRPNQRAKVWVKVVAQVRRHLDEASHTSEVVAGTPSHASTETINRLGGSLSPSELVAYAAHLNKEQRYDEVIQLLVPLTKAQPDDELAWLAYSYALAKSGRQEAGVAAFVQAYNLHQRSEHTGEHDITFPTGGRLTVFAGYGSGTYNHGLLEQPKRIYALGPHGGRQVVFDTVGSTTVHVTNTAAEPWIAVAANFDSQSS